MSKTRTVRGAVTETITFYKDVEVEVDEDADADAIEQALRKKALEDTIPDGVCGWFMDGSSGIEVAIVEEPEAT